MRAVHYALVLSLLFHLAVFTLLSDKLTASLVSPQPVLPKALNVTFAAKSIAVIAPPPTAEPLPELQLQPDAAVKSLQKDIRINSDSASQEPAEPTPANDNLAPVAGSDQAGFSVLPARIKHPLNWIAFKVDIAADGSIIKYAQVSKEDANSVSYARLAEEIRNLKLPTAGSEKTLLVSGPPLRIETDPALISEYFSTMPP
jgi:hypothetical protein